MKKSARYCVCFALAYLFILHQGIAQAQNTVQVKGPNVASVTFGDEGGVRGRFVHVGDKNWNRLNPDRSVVSSFVETARDEWSVYLRDASGTVNVHLNLWTKTVTQRSGTTTTTLGKVLDAAHTAAAATPEPPQGDPGCQPPECVNGVIRGEVVLGDVVGSPCPEGHRQGSGNACVVDVFFHSEPNLSIAAAQAQSAQNGWVLATAEEVQAAWEKLALDRYAFGLLADGRFAVPVQSDHSNFKRGANIGATGGNQGFFYVLASARPKTQAAPASTDPSKLLSGSGWGAEALYPGEIPSSL